MAAAPLPGQLPNELHDVSFFSCRDSSYWIRKIDNSRGDHLGRLTVESLDGSVFHQQENVPYTNADCQAHFTIQFTDGLLLAFLVDQKQLFVTFEACRPSSQNPSCGFDETNLLPPMLVGEHLNSLLPDLFALLTSAIGIERTERMNADAQETAERIAGDAALGTAIENLSQGVNESLAEKVSREGDSMTGDLVLDGGSLLRSSCPPGVDDMGVTVTDSPYENTLCASEMLTTPPGAESLYDVAADALQGVCRTLPDGTFVQAADYLGPMLDLWINQSIHGVNDLAENIEQQLDLTVDTVVGEVNSGGGYCTGNTSSEDCTEDSLAQFVCALTPSGIDCDYDFRWLSTSYNLSFPEIPTIDVVDLLDEWIGEWVGVMDDVCADIDGALVPFAVAALSSVSWPIPGGDDDALPTSPGDWENIYVPELRDAQSACLARGAHVCSLSEASMLTPPGQTLYSALGFEGGEWLGTGSSGKPMVTYDTEGSSFLAAVPWPPINLNMEATWEWPPGSPMAMSPPRLPTGRFRCCTSTSSTLP